MTRPSLESTEQHLSTEILSSMAPAVADVPDEEVLSLPETVLQFGSGRFIRAFADAFIHEANLKGERVGRVVIVQSTGAGRSNILEEQDGLFTVCVQGIAEGEAVRSYHLVSAISRALPANQVWNDVLEVARRPELHLVLSNTTEVGLTLDEEDRIDRDPPRSFPGKLTACLYERYQVFDGDPERGLVIIPCELVEQNGDVLRQLVIDTATKWQLGEGFLDWIRQSNTFCNTLVDRIVTGKPDAREKAEHEAAIGYQDELLTVAEPYRLWAIQGNADVQQRLAWTQAVEGIVVAEDIDVYRLLKVRILNGAHTSMVPLAFLAGNDTVLQSMQDPLVAAFVDYVMDEEIVSVLDVGAGRAAEYARAVRDRFRNPFLQHQLLSIAAQQTTKMRHRVVPSLVDFARQNGRLPEGLTLGFASYLYFMRTTRTADGTRTGQRGETSYELHDTKAEEVATAWDEQPQTREALQALVAKVAARDDLWGHDLSKLEGFVDKVARYLDRFQQEGVRVTLEGWGEREKGRKGERENRGEGESGRG